MEESAEPIQNSERHELVIGERVGGPPLVTAAVTHSHEEPTPAAEAELLKVEPVARGVVHMGVAQPLVEAMSVTAASEEAASVEASPVARSQRIRNEDPSTEAARRTRRRAAPVAMQPGSRVCSNFTHDGRPQWFVGVILEQGSRQVRGSDGVLRWVPAAKGWTVKFFHDGEECAVQEHSLKHEEEIAVPERLGLSDVGAIQNSDGHELVMPPAMPAGAVAKEEEAPPAMPADAVVKEEAITRDTELPGPRPGAHIKVDYEEHSCRVKDEHEQQAASGILRQKDTETLKREAQRRKLQVEPDGKTPRAVFRAGCAYHCLTKVLGGNGTDNRRFVREDKVMPDGHVLIRKGEMYLWGRADWNTYAPSFAGDVGAYRDMLPALLLQQQEHMGWEKPQETFHLFRQCTHRFLIDFPLSAYHGKGSEKKTLYCGKYRVDYDLTYEQSFKEMPDCTKQSMCKLQAERELGKGSTVEHKLEVARRANEIMPQREEENEVFTMCSVEFVEYDEKLYRALVASGASNGRIEVDDAKLGPL